MPEIVSTIVEVCAFRRRQPPNGEEFLLLQRSESDRIYPGLWQLITGSIRGTETAVSAALREMSEETGITPARVWVVPLVNSFYVASDDVVHLTTVFAAEVHSDSVIKLSSEHQNYLWLGYEQTLNKLVWPGQRRVITTVQEFILRPSSQSRLTEILLPERNLS
jgi:dATP pyrophosphohydrolase